MLYCLIGKVVVTMVGFCFVVIVVSLLFLWVESKVWKWGQKHDRDWIWRRPK